jgi:hypothetical protein
MEEKLDKTDYFLMALFSILILTVITAFIYIGYLKVSAEKYQDIISGEIIEVKNGETINPAGYVVSPGVGVALAKSASVLVKISNEVVEVSLGNTPVGKTTIGKKAIIKEKGIIQKEKKIREELILLSIE